VKVKWFRYRPGVAQRVGRGIALLFHGTRRGWVVSSTPRPHFTPEKDPVPFLQEAGWAPGPVWTGGKSHKRYHCPLNHLWSYLKQFIRWRLFWVLVTSQQYASCRLAKSFLNKSFVISCITRWSKPFFFRLMALWAFPSLFSSVVKSPSATQILPSFLIECQERRSTKYLT